MSEGRDSTILVVDDEPDLCANLKQVLEREDYQVVTATNGVEALDVLQTRAVNLILADVAMPRMNGYQLYEKVRAHSRWTLIPFVFLTGRGLDSDIRYGKELGADDYLIKPFELRDLLATVRGKLRRAQQLAQLTDRLEPCTTVATDVMVVGALRIDTNQRQVWLNKVTIRLSSREFTLLERLARRAGDVISFSELLRATHQLETDQGEAGTLLRPLVRSLRRKLGYTAGDMGCIENVRGVGYRLVAP